VIESQRPSGAEIRQGAFQANANRLVASDRTTSLKMKLTTPAPAPGPETPRGADPITHGVSATAPSVLR
jgi:hypothetical protein